MPEGAKVFTEPDILSVDPVPSGALDGLAVVGYHKGTAGTGIGRSLYLGTLNADVPLSTDIYSRPYRTIAIRQLLIILIYRHTAKIVNLKQE